jgi:hypothetical protein
MPFQEFDGPVNPVVLVLLLIGIRWGYGLNTGYKPANVGALILWGMVGAVIVYILLLGLPWLVGKLVPPKSPEKKD